MIVVKYEQREREDITSQLQKYSREHNLRMEIDAYEDGADFVESYGNQYDIVICDIQMKFTGGIETAEFIRAKNQEIAIIFVTNMAEFSIRGYEVDASGYILKPLSYPVLERYLDRVIAKLHKNETKYLVINTAKTVMRIPLDEIIYIESEKHYQIIHTVKETYRILTELKKIEENLPTSGFMRCNNGCIVNFRHVEKLDRNDVYAGGVALAISRNRKKEFTEALTEYMMNNM